MDYPGSDKLFRKKKITAVCTEISKEKNYRNTTKHGKQIGGGQAKKT